MRNEQLLGKKCINRRTIQIMNSNAGYYLGTVDEHEPYCRITGYYSDSATLKAGEYQYRDCAENNYCNQCRGCFLYS